MSSKSVLPAESSSASPSARRSSLTTTQLINKLTKLTSTYSGLDASLMIIQYSTPLVIALLLKINQLKTKYGYHRLFKNKQSNFGLLELSQGWGQMGKSIGEARVIFRLFGMLPIISWLLALHPKPLESINKLLYSIISLNSNFITRIKESSKTIPTLQAISLLLYYPLEHLSWLTTKKVVPLSERRRGLAELWSVRFWALYVVLEIYKLSQSYQSLQRRTKLLKYSSKSDISKEESEGYELPPSPSSPNSNNEKVQSVSIMNIDKKVEIDALKKDWNDWLNTAVINSGYAPLTIHWSTPGGLWTSPLIGGSLGIVAALGRLTAEWRKGNS
ncbi:uncharacterized protein L201_005426 [Kwoniella dendrophila CBS 6074]|uniref:Peroxin-11C n=1 Tax=Kwoniella dendrophila CBS 6074 TaxID=1295534 RepID=A0AAX4JYM2_9TREE